MRTVPGLGRDVVAVGVVVLLGLIATGTIVKQQVGRLPWDSDQITVKAEFSDAVAVNPTKSQQVRIAGVPVGLITGAEATNRGTSIISMDIDKGNVVYDNAHARLRPVNPLNEMYVDLDPGGPPAKPLAEGKPIPLAQTDRPTQVDEILSHLDTRTQNAWPLAVMASAAAITLAVFGWLAVPISLGVLALLPILLGVGSDFPLYLAQGAHRHRVVVSGLASAAAAACLCLCPLPIVRQLGLALAGGILLVIALGLVLGRWAPGPHTGSADPLSPTWTRPRRSVAALLLLVTAVVAGAGWALLPRIGIDANPQRVAAGLSAIDDATHVQEALMGSPGRRGRQ
jgi:hypothetical protein